MFWQRTSIRVIQGIGSAIWKSEVMMTPMGQQQPQYEITISPYIGLN